MKSAIEEFELIKEEQMLLRRFMLKSAIEEFEQIQEMEDVDVKLELKSAIEEFEHDKAWERDEYLAVEIGHRGI